VQDAITNPGEKMKTKLIFVLPTTVLTLCLFWFLLFTGCETEVDEAWDGFGDSDHFAAPHEGDHLGFLMENPELLEDCQECHGADYDGGTSGVSCIDCHAASEAYEGSCNICHGMSDSVDIPAYQAPPLDLAGNESTDEFTVGSHRTHMIGGEYSDGIECQSCHIVPDSWSSRGHIDESPAEVIFGGFSGWHEHNPVLDSETGTCSDTYCHGDFAPEWTTVDGSQAECGSCHTLPPPTPHYNATIETCVQCHSSVIDGEGNIINKALHINGTVNN